MEGIRNTTSRHLERSKQQKLGNLIALSVSNEKDYNDLKTFLHRKGILWVSGRVITEDYLPFKDISTEEGEIFIYPEKGDRISHVRITSWINDNTYLVYRIVEGPKKEDTLEDLIEGMLS